MLVEQTQDAGTLDPISAEVAARVLDLTHKCVDDAMVPRARVATLDLDMSEREIAERVWNTQFTRMPVWSKRKGRWIGVANVKMLLLRYARSGHLRLRDAIYVPITLRRGAPMARALRLFRKRKQHLAFVIADDGAQVGIVTLEDVLEQMVGAIDDELDLLEGEADRARMSRGSLEKAERPSIA
jgi:CBS domain containing-hemolysin-like protein